MTEMECQRDESRERLVFLLAALEDVGRILAERNDLHDSSKHLLRLLLGTIGISRGAIYTCARGSGALILEVSTFQDLAPGALLDFPISPIRLFGPDFLPLDLEQPDRVFPPEIKPLLDAWSKSGVRILAPLSVRDHFLALICLGSRFMQIPYTPEDVEIIHLLSCHISLFFYSRHLLAETRTANFNLNRKILELENLFELGLSITSLRTAEDLVSDVVTQAAAILNARFGAIVGFSGHVAQVRASFGFQIQNGSIPDELRGVPYVDVTADPNARNDDHYIIAQLVSRGVHRGVLIVMLKENRKCGFDRFTDADQALLTAFANQAAVGLDNSELLQQAIEKERMEKELDVAAEIQRALLPACDPRIPGLDVSGRTIPCRTVGGDFFGYAPLASGKCVITVADVSGKGIPAALLVSTFHAAFLALHEQFESLACAVGMLNQIIYRATPENRFITACLACWNPLNETLDFVVAGHESPILIHANGDVEYISEGGLILGLFQSVSYAHHAVQLLPGDIVCFYSDGITDLINSVGERFESARLLECLQNHRDLPVAGIIDKVFEKMSCFQGNTAAPDDQTLVLFKCISAHTV